MTHEFLTGFWGIGLIFVACTNTQVSGSSGVASGRDTAGSSAHARTGDTSEVTWLSDSESIATVPSSPP